MVFLVAIALPFAVTITPYFFSVFKDRNNKNTNTITYAQSNDLMRQKRECIGASILENQVNSSNKQMA